MIVKYLNDKITKRISGFSKFLNDFIYFSKDIICYSFCKSISICKYYSIIFFILSSSFMLDAQEQRSFVYSSSKKEIYRNKKSYELTNHLGNVLTTVSDRKEVGLSATPIVTAEVKTATDYFPGGMLMPLRNYSFDDNYRYKHQGQESDDDLTGDGNNYFYKYRMSDARLNRFWSVDPLHRNFLYNSNYAYSENRLIDGTDLEGKEWSSTGKYYNSISGKFEIQRTLKIQIINFKDIVQNQLYLESIKNDMALTIEKDFSSGNGTFLDPRIETKVEYVESGPFKLRLYEAEGVLDPVTQKVGYTTGYVSKIGESSMQTVNVSVSLSYNGIQDKRHNNEIARTASHEVGHSAGLEHPFHGAQELEYPSDEVHIMMSF